MLDRVVAKRPKHPGVACHDQACAVVRMCVSQLSVVYKRPTSIHFVAGGDDALGSRVCDIESKQ